MSNLFKLKKDGKVVGYLKIDKSAVWFKYPTNKDYDLYDWYKHPAWETAHPFVCKDKNGKDVFAGDDIKGTIETILQTENVSGWIEWFEADKRWDLLTKEGSVSIALSEIEDIELIEAKK